MRILWHMFVVDVVGVRLQKRRCLLNVFAMIPRGLGGNERWKATEETVLHLSRWRFAQRHDFRAVWINPSLLWQSTTIRCLCTSLHRETFVCGWVPCLQKSTIRHSKVKGIMSFLLLGFAKSKQSKISRLTSWTIMVVELMFTEVNVLRLFSHKVYRSCVISL